MSRNIKKYMPVLLLILLGTLLTVLCLPLIEWLRIPGNRDLLWQKIDALGPWGMGIFLLIQILQVVIAFIPGEPVELAGGMLYGTFGGLALCLCGILIGSSLIFAAVRRFGQPLVDRFTSPEAAGKYAFLTDARKLDTLIFLMFLIPGTPKDTLNYLCPLTPISPARFLILSTFARLPSVISSTFAGANFARGNLGASIAVLAVTSLVGLIGIRYEKVLTDRLNRSAARIRDRFNGSKS